MGIFNLFKPKIEASIKFNHELCDSSDNESHRRVIKIPAVSERILNQQPANPSLTSQATGRVFFKPELLGLAGKNFKEPSREESRTFHNELITTTTTTDESIPIFKDGDSVRGSLFLKVPQSAGNIGHYGIKVDFLGVLEFPGGLKPSITFCALSSNLAAEGRLVGGEVSVFPFEFKHVEMSHESFNGRHLQIKYFIKMTIKRGISDAHCQRPIWVQDFTPCPIIKDLGWQLEVGLEDLLHINFTSARTQYSLDECIEGELHFSLVNLKIKGADLSIVRRELVGSQITDQEVLQHFQIIDGSPARYDTIPFRLPLANLAAELTPTLRQVEKAASLLYFINLIIYDVEGRRYFKQQEISLFRREGSEKRLYKLLSQ